MITVFWINHGYASDAQFSTFDAAVDYARSKCFEASFWQGEEFLGSWSPIGGTRKAR